MVLSSSDMIEQLIKSKWKLMDHLRREGYSYSVIQKETGISKGKISQILTAHKRDCEKGGVSLTENDTVQEREVI